MEEQAPQIMQATPPPAPRPESMHRHSAAPILAGLLGVLLVAETAFMGWGVTQFFAVQADLDKVVEEKEALQVTYDTDKAAWEKSGRPFFYVDQSNDGKGMYTSILYAVEANGEKNELYRQTTEAEQFRLFSVPQVNYNGTIYLGFQCVECYVGIPTIKSFDVEKKEVGEKVAWNESLPGNSQAFSISPDGQTIAAFYYNPADLESEGSREVIFFDIATGKKEVVGKIEPNEYFAEYTGDSVFGGADGYHSSWLNTSCVSTMVYSDSTVPLLGGKKVYSSTKTFCSKK